MRRGRLTISDILDSGDIAPEHLRDFHGFGGLHGGVLAALLLRSMRAQVADTFRPLELTVHYLRPVRSQTSVHASALNAGRATAAVTARADVDGSPVATATGVFGATGSPALGLTFSPKPPGGLTDLDLAKPFVVPPEFVPISTRMEIRPASPALPYSGSVEPELCAWVRVTEAVPNPLERLLILADALAPSYAAALSDLLMIPTARMTVRFTPPAATSDFDWVLIRALTVEAHADRWLTETIDVWTPDGIQLATSTQLRVARP